MSEPTDMEVIDGERGVEERSVDGEMKRSYLEYAMSVIVGRALPDARDGLKPVQRRVLYTMHKTGNHHNKPFVKSANIVGECFVEGTLVHTPHGLRAIEDIVVGDDVLRPMGGTTSVTQTFKNPPQRVVDVTLSNRRTLTVTPGQLFRVLSEDYTPRWVRADQLEPSMRIFSITSAAHPPHTSEGQTTCHAYAVGPLVTEDRPHDQNVTDTYQEADCVMADPAPIFNQLSAAHLSSGWYPNAEGETSRAGLRSGSSNYQYGSERFGSTVTAAVEDQAMSKLERVGSPLFERLQSIERQTFVTVRSVTPHGIDRETFDIQVADDDHAFLAEGCVVHNCMGKFHPHGDSAIYDTMVRMAQNWQLRVPFVDGQGNWGCFTGDTEIELIDGTRRSFAELSELPKDKVFYVYSVNAAGRIVVGEGRNARITRRSAKLVRVTLDNGAEIRCTPDHLFMLRDGAYEEAINLTSDHSLMPGYFDHKTVRETKDKSLYLRIMQPDTQEYEFVHQIADQHNKDQRLATECPAPWVRHHTNFNRDDNRPVNNHSEAVEVNHQRLIERSKNVEFIAYLHENSPSSQTYNHRVVSVEHIVEREDVYDITVDQHHNFLLSSGVFVHNSRDGDSAAAYRYSEARMTNAASQMLRDIEQETVDWVDNYDGQHKEPAVLPARIPALLVNGAAGIAVGMATQIPPHNLREVVEGVKAMIDDPEIDVAGLMQHVTAPDMPTGGLIVGRAGIRQAYETGRGKLIVRGVTHVESRGGGRERIVVTELPYTVQKGDGRGDGSGLIMKMVELVRDKRIPEIVDIRDESTKDVRIVIELRAGSIPQVVLNKLYKHTSLQLTTGINMVALNHGQPQTMNLKELLRAYLDHQVEVVTRRTRYQLNKARARAHLLEGLLIALDVLDRVIEIIRGSDTQEKAQSQLMEEIGLTKIQADYVLERQLRSLTSLNIDAVRREHDELVERIAELRAILGNEQTILVIVREELDQVADLYGTERQSVIIPGEDDFDVEDLIPETLSVVMLTDAGYLKRVSLEEFRAQSRGGTGSKGVGLQDGADGLKIARICSTHEWILAFTNRGRLWRLRGWQVPEGGKGSKGRALANLLPLETDEQIVALCNTREFDDRNLLFATRRGVIKRTALRAYDSPFRTVALRAIKLADDDELVGVRIADDDQTAIVLSGRGRAQRFAVTEARKTGRVSGGVRAMRLLGDDSIVSLSVHDDDDHLLLVTADGFGKRVPMREFLVRHRGGQGVRAIPEGSRGAIVGGVAVEENDELLIITAKGMVQRIAVGDVSAYSRASKGIRVMRVGTDDEVTIMCLIRASELAATTPEALAEAVGDTAENNGLPGPVVTDAVDLDEEELAGIVDVDEVSDGELLPPEEDIE